MTLLIDTKPTLEWVEYEPYFNIDGDGKSYSAESVFGEYQLLFPDPDPMQETNYFLLGLFYPSMGFHTECVHGFPLTYNTESEAKAAAQADYERRTAERFVKVEVPNKLLYSFRGIEYENGWNDFLDTIAKATEAK